MGTLAFAGFQGGMMAVSDAECGDDDGTKLRHLCEYLFGSISENIRY